MKTGCKLLVFCFFFNKMCFLKRGDIIISFAHVFKQTSSEKLLQFLRTGWSSKWRFCFSICKTELWQINKTLESMYVLINFHCHPFVEQIVWPFAWADYPEEDCLLFTLQRSSVVFVCIEEDTTHCHSADSCPWNSFAVSHFTCSECGWVVLLFK